MKNVLVTTDFSENAWDALRYAQNLYSEKSTHFFVLHVSDFINYPLYSDTHIEDGANLHTITSPSREQLNDLMRLISKEFKDTHHRYSALHEHGFFIETIKKAVEAHAIDLIVMGTKGATGLRQRIIGSNTGDVITKVQCDTLVIPNGITFKRPRELAFPTDYNIFYTHKILTALTELLQLGNGTLRVMNVSKTGNDYNLSQLQNRDYLEDYLKESFPERNSFHTLTNRSVNAAIQCFVESRDIDMIIMVAKNLNFIQQILFDSLVEKISFHTTVPFYVMHE